MRIIRTRLRGLEIRKRTWPKSIRHASGRGGDGLGFRGYPRSLGSSPAAGRHGDLLFARDCSGRSRNMQLFPSLCGTPSTAPLSSKDCAPPCSLLPSVSNDPIQPLDPSRRNPLKYKGLNLTACGLRPQAPHRPGENSRPERIQRRNKAVSRSPKSARPSRTPASQEGGSRHEARSGIAGNFVRHAV
jgi:hypothetical protein